MNWNTVSRPFASAWNYLKPSWEGEDGKPSYRRASQFVFLVLISFMVLKGLTLQQWGFWTFLVLCLAFLLLAAIITADQILKGIHGLSGLQKMIVQEQDNSSPDVTKTTTTVEVKPVAKAEGEEGG
jgi:hypothetical protein